jgi:DNA/RNA-binding domain of Phe-tRNA-synthetase-like protein
MARSGTVSADEPGRRPRARAPQEAAFAPERGWCSHDLEQELPGLTLLSAEIRVARPGPLTGGSPRDVRERLRELSNRYRGAAAVSMRRDPIPVAYRVFFRQIGLDPEVARTPIEGAVLNRMLHGGFLSTGLLEDVLLIALLDTAVPVWALDVANVEGPLGIRASADGESLGRGADAATLPAGRLVIADAAGPVATLFGEVAAGHAPAGFAERVVAFAVIVAGVPELYAEEALWAVRSALEWG